MNRLGGQLSPYLLQHQHNPVDWFPWGAEAFDVARRDDKPIFLSIGYSTCHWCHVMERESFEDDATARFLNGHMVSIKVDREERPDLDQIYMDFVQTTTGQGGWPLTVFLTPDLKPFYGGTYFPPDNRYGKPSFMEVLQAVDRGWRNHRPTLSKYANETCRLLADAGPGDTVQSLGPMLLQQAATQLKAAFDPLHGGFGDAPKFPQPCVVRVLLDFGCRTGDEDVIGMVLRTCDHMAAGGIHDQIGGGFARYATDEAWLIPHFEKMLYDNAQLARLYLDAYRISGEAMHAAVARGILDYVLRDMTHPDGGFYSAEDADSEGREGKFYCWTRAEMAEVLSAEEFELAVRRFGITEQGNFLDHSDSNPLQGQNILHVADSRLETGDGPLLAGVVTKLLAARSRRVRPFRDDKILAAWNGLMLGAFAQAGEILGDESYRKAARRNADFIKASLWEADHGVLHSRWRQGVRDDIQLLSAYAALLGGMLDLYETTLEGADIGFAVALAEALLARFFDEGTGGFWQRPREAVDLIFRTKDTHDAAEPSGSSMAVHALLRLAEITGRRDFAEAAEATLRFYSGRLNERPQAMPAMLQAAAFWMNPHRRVVIVGDGQAAGTQALLAAVHFSYHPDKIILGTAGPVDSMAAALATSTASPAAHVCLGTSCQSPINDPLALRAALQ